MEGVCECGNTGVSRYESTGVQEYGTEGWKDRGSRGDRTKARVAYAANAARPQRASDVRTACAPCLQYVPSQANVVYHDQNGTAAWKLGWNLSILVILRHKHMPCTSPLPVFNLPSEDQREIGRSYMTC